MRISQKKEFADLLKCLRDEEVHRLPEGEKCLAATQINTSKKLSRWKAWPAIIALILLCAGFLVMNPNVYAAVITWFKGGKVEEINQNGAFNSMFYYELPGISDKTAEYRFTWIPERFDRKELLSKEDSRCDYGEEYSYMIHDESSPKLRNYFLPTKAIIYCCLKTKELKRAVLPENTITIITKVFRLQISILMLSGSTQ